MTDESPRNGGSRPVPDPTLLTDAAIAKAIAAMRDYVDGQLDIRDERLRGIDRATELRWPTVEDLPDQIADAVGHNRALTDEKFASIAIQFSERDTRAENDKRDGKVAVDAAFAAQKEAAAKQDESNQKAIDKSEAAMAEKITTLSDLYSAGTGSLAGKIDDLKERVARIESVKVGATESRTGVYASIGVAATLFFVLLAIVGFLATRVP